MNDSILQHAPEDVKEAAFFAFQQPHDLTLEARVEASGLAYMLLRRAERAEQALEVQTERAEKAEQRVAALDIRDHALQDMRSANGKLIKIQQKLQGELHDTAAELGVTERQRKQAEFELSEAKQAIARLTRDLAAAKELTNGQA